MHECSVCGRTTSYKSTRRFYGLDVLHKAIEMFELEGLSAEETRLEMWTRHGLDIPFATVVTWRHKARKKAGLKMKRNYIVYAEKRFSEGAGAMDVKREIKEKFGVSRAYSKVWVWKRRWENETGR